MFALNSVNEEASVTFFSFKFGSFDMIESFTVIYKFRSCSLSYLRAEIGAYSHTEVKNGGSVTLCALLLDVGETSIIS